MTTGQFIWAIVIVVTLLGLVAWWSLASQATKPPTPEGARRAVGNALFVIDEFVNPRMEHVLTARQDQIQEDEEPGSDDDPEAYCARLKTELAASLAADPADPIDIRRHLASALRAGLDWRAFYEDAVRAEAAARPLRALRLPPLTRVAPFERDDAVGGPSRDA